MNDTLTLSERGQITLPAGLRRQLGLKPGDALVVERVQGAVMLRPAVVLPYDVYDDRTIERWSDDDDWAPGERARAEKKLRRQAP